LYPFNLTSIHELLVPRFLRARVKIKDWRSNTLTKKNNPDCEAALAVNQKVSAGKGEIKFPVLLTSNKNSSPAGEAQEDGGGSSDL
jgi:hypothetical protein